MNFGGLNFESMLSGSHAIYRKREIPPFSEEEREINVENQNRLSRGINILRKMKTAVFEEENKIIQQEVLRQAHELSDHIAQAIIERALADRRGRINQDLINEIKELSKNFEHHESSSAYSIPPSQCLFNLLNAADDMLVRVEEKAISLSEPDHKLDREETEYVFSEFLNGVNCLNKAGRESFFREGTKIGAILSGGTINMALAAEIIKRYSDPSLSIEYFAVAIDKESQKCVCEAGEGSLETKEVVIVDDTINKGGTILAAQWNVGEYFPKAVIRTGMEVDYAGGFEERRFKNFRNHLDGLFYDYADLERDGRFDEALVLFEEASKYAEDHELVLTPGWHRVKARIDEKKNSFK